MQNCLWVRTSGLREGKNSEKTDSVATDAITPARIPLCGHFPIFQLPQVLATDSSQLLPSLDNCSQPNRNHSVWVVTYPHACMPGSLEPVTDVRGNKGQAPHLKVESVLLCSFTAH